MRIHIPNSAFLGNIDPFIRSFDPSKPRVLKITANKRWISVHPVVLCMVAALGIRSDTVRCEELEARSRHYLERMGLFKFLRISSGLRFTEHEPAGRFIPLTQVRDSDQLSHFLRDMIPLLHLEQDQADAIRYVVGELIRNVIEHAKSPHGAIVCAQYYKQGMIRIGVVDIGVGIRSSIMQSHRITGDLDAIRLALTPGITGTTMKEGGTESNAGAGLFFIRSIAKVHRDFFVIYSGSALYKLLKSAGREILHADPFDDNHSKRADFPAWQGTVVGIDISLRPTKEFSHLMDLIRDTYVKTIKERKKAQYRKPQFL